MKVGIVMGSKSDYPVVERAEKILADFGIEYETRVISAHRTPRAAEKFASEAEANGMVNLKGHRTVGGMRASIYNAMPMEGVEKLVAFMKEFEARNK